MDMQRRIKNCLVTVLTSLIILTFTSVSAFSAEYLSIKNDGVNIRSGPSTKAEVLWEIFKDFPVKVLKKQGQWVKTEDFEGDTGWVYRPLLSKKRTVIVSVKTANMRIGPGTNYEPLATVKYGVVFKVVEKDSGWLKLLHVDGTSGWIHQKLLWPKF